MSLNWLRWIALAALVSGSSLGCATSSDVDALRVELDTTRKIAKAAQRQAEAAAAEARAASDEARKAATAAAASAAEARPPARRSRRSFRKVFASSGVAEDGLPAGARSSAPPAADRVRLLKAERRLLLFRGEHLLAAYRVALGSQPEGPKERRGDGRTPEGRYVLDRRQSESEFHRGIHISYPSPRDRARAAAAGVSPGGGIMIHGLPNGLGEHRRRPRGGRLDQRLHRRDQPGDGRDLAGGARRHPDRDPSVRAWPLLGMLLAWPVVRPFRRPTHEIVHTRREDTLLDIARDHDLGYREMIAANPGVDPWLPGEGTEVVVPSAAPPAGGAGRRHRRQPRRATPVLLPAGWRARLLPDRNRPGGLAYPDRHHRGGQEAGSPDLVPHGLGAARGPDPAQGDPTRSREPPGHPRAVSGLAALPDPRHQRAVRHRAQGEPGLHPPLSRRHHPPLRAGRARYAGARHQRAGEARLDRGPPLHRGPSASLPGQ